MGTYGEAVADVLEIVPRPDKDSLIRSKLNGAIRYISTSGLFWRDIVETTIGAADGVDDTVNIQSIPITTAVRRMVYVQYPTYTDEDDRITLVDLESLQKRELCTKLGDIAYLSGSALHIRNGTRLTATFNIAYYTNPVNFATDGTEDDNTNWILELAPELVVDLTATYVLNLIGDNEDSKRIGDITSLMKQTYIRDFMTSVGA